MTPLRQSFGLALVASVLGFGLSFARAGGVTGEGRDAALAAALGARGLEADRAAIVWLDAPPLGVWRAAVGTSAAVVRARPGPEEAHDIYLVDAKLSPEGVLLRTGRAYNLTETTAVDELPPVAAAGRIAFVEQPLLDGALSSGAAPDGAARPSRVRVIDLGGEDAGPRGGWGRFERAQAAVTRLQETGRLAGVGRASYVVQPAPALLLVSLADSSLSITADTRRVSIPFAAPFEPPEWLSVDPVEEARPGGLVTWAVDRVRAEIGDNAMQYVKAFAFSALDVVLSGSEAMTGDTGAQDIAADLGEQELGETQRAIPVDPEIGFPPPPLEPWVTPALAGEGQWNAKIDDPIIHSLPGLPPTFVTTFIRGDRQRKATRVYVALWDPRLVQLNMMAGLAEPKSATGETGAGTIPREPQVMERVAAAFNAGFQSLHGEFGMMSDGVIYLPPKPYAATVATLRDGGIAFGTWPNDPAIPAEMLSYRQNMTPIVQDGKFNPYGRTWWGGTPSDWEDKTHTVRTGICLTAEGYAAYFYGADLSPEALAQAMLQTRCSYGIALDMNAGHSGLEWYHVARELAPMQRPLDHDWEREGDVPGANGWHFRARRMVKGMGLMYFPRYIKTEGRDYFYLTLRHVLPGAPLAARVAWQVKGLPQHGFPYALARAETEVGGARVRVLKLDPRMVTLGAALSSASAPDGAEGTPVVATLEPAGEGPLALYLSPDAAVVAKTALAPGSLQLAAGKPVPSKGSVAAALGVERDSGMIVYLEPVDPTRAPAAAAVKALFVELGCHGSIGLDAPLALALGGDSDTAGRPTRVLASDRRVTLVRKPSLGGRRMFETTPIVPLRDWYPLQAKRIRYFKKKKGEGDT